VFFHNQYLKKTKSVSLQHDLADDSNLFELRIGQHAITMTKESRKMVSEYSNGFAVP